MAVIGKAIPLHTGLLEESGVTYIGAAKTHTDILVYPLDRTASPETPEPHSLKVISYISSSIGIYPLNQDSPSGSTSNFIEV